MMSVHAGKSRNGAAFYPAAYTKVVQCQCATLATAQKPCRTCRQVDDAVYMLLMSRMFCSSAGTIKMTPYCIRTSPLTSIIALLRFTLKRRLLLRSTVPWRSLPVISSVRARCSAWRACSSCCADRTFSPVTCMPHSVRGCRPGMAHSGGLWECDSCEFVKLLPDLRRIASI